ncbi:MAG: hypothetical protein WCJ64_00605 [Rhodospirillaceae bacterium]
MNRVIRAVLAGLVSLVGGTALAASNHAFFAAVGGEGQASAEGGLAWCKAAVKVNLILDSDARSAGNAGKQKMIGAKLRSVAGMDCPTMKAFSLAVIENGVATNHFSFSAPDWAGETGPKQAEANATVPAPAATALPVAAAPAAGLTMAPAVPVSPPEPPKAATPTVPAAASPPPVTVAPTMGPAAAAGCLKLPETIKDVPAGLCFEAGMMMAVALPPSFDNLIGYYPWNRGDFFDPWGWKRVPQFANAHSAFQGARGYLVVPTAGKATLRMEMTQNPDWDYSCTASLQIEGKKIIEFTGHSIPNANNIYWRAETAEFDKPGLYKIEVGQNCDYIPSYDPKLKDRPVTWRPTFSLAIRQHDDDFMRPVGPTEIVRKVKVVQ